ncbi:hypothetical protein GCM10012290_08500 [Halolactibacillus alkaliphilus]|uniref:Uncharacterized protein n=1 Tax=Halolactibacillus alkaliphilus TaxID=442899 RepID=A0A511X052_9BACI|nr:hypothetical protein [Halolactibacillus alkaliphilus]GEN56322.1 hypothetical protein HAL01_07860 [Halolactibacillus alkaliphilus]GGN67688.1 hypothetical protein GCM10012290_08500 [Halolactibacillus alkaliphilus]SFO79009.1 hypothetical protein SAMN05720591_11134 [Halolactibacillus alkaliphilus]
MKPNVAQIIVVVIYVLVLQFYFNQPDRHLLHLLLGVALSVFPFKVYKNLKQRNKKKGPATFYRFLFHHLYVVYLVPAALYCTFDGVEDET